MNITGNRKVFNRYFTEEEERKLFKTVRAQAGVLPRRDAAWMLLMRKTAIRVGTMSGLTIADANEGLKTGYLPRRPEISKNGQGGKTYLVKEALAALRTLLSVHREMGGNGRPEQPLVLSINQVALSVRSYQSRMKEWVKLAGIKDGSPHWWRHTAAKRVMKYSTSSDPRGIVAGVLDHSGIDSSAVYSMPDKEDIEHEMNQAL